MARFKFTDDHHIEPGQRAEEAVREIFTVLLADLRQNILGAIEGADPEHLHDLRVASRRTRSLLTQLKGVLPKKETRSFAAEFKWLGQLTGPCRDFDVWTLERQDQRAGQPAGEAAVLDPLDEEIADRRETAHAAVIEGLRSDRFGNLLENWDAFLRNPGVSAKEPKNARREVKALADKHIIKAYQRLVRRGRELDVDSPAAEVHRLRIDAKKLRYLLECFRTLFPEEVIEPQIGKLKKLQDALGGFNDMAVQQRYLAELKGELEPEVNTDTIRAIDRLAIGFADRQQAYRNDLLERLKALCGQETRAELRDSFRG